MPSKVGQMPTTIFITNFFIILMCKYADGATPQRQRLNNLEYAYRYGSSLPIEQQQLQEISNAPNFRFDEALRILKTQQQQQPKFSINSNEIWSPTNADGIFYNEEHQLQPRRFYWTSDYRKAAQYNAGQKQKLEVYQTPALTLNQFSQHNQSPHTSIAAHTSEIIYAPRAQRYNQQLRAPSLIRPLSDDSFNIEPLCVHHKTHSNQKQYAPKRPADVNNPHDAHLPFPPSFISITSTTSTTAAPPHSIQNICKQSDHGVTCRSQLPDIFAKRQHKSLLDSYIPSWVLLRMLQQHKLLQSKQLHQFVATHTLAFPITKKTA